MYSNPSPTSSSISTATSTVRKRKKKKKHGSGSPPDSNGSPSPIHQQSAGGSLHGATNFTPATPLDTVPELDSSPMWRSLSGNKEAIAAAAAEALAPPQTTSIGLPPRHPTHPSRPAAKSMSEGVELLAPTLSASPTRSPRPAPAVAKAPSTELPRRAPGVLDVLAAELHMAHAASAEDVWGQTQRDRVYNALLYVPFQLERLLLFGLLTCVVSLTSVLVVLPLRTVLDAIKTLRTGVRSLLAQPAHGQQCPRLVGLSGPQLYDLLCLAIMGGVSWALITFHTGTLYFWLKDLTNEFLKLQVIFTALEIADKALCNFGVDAFEALLGTCCAAVSRPSHRRSWTALTADVVVAVLTVYGHCMVLVCQAMVFSVAINSKKRALTALLIAANFVEIKGTIFKRYDAHKLLTLTRQDVVERFHLLLTLAFVVCEEAQDGFAPARLWALLRCEWLPMCRDVVIMCAHRHCGAIFGSEVVIDVIKHAILGKLNDMRPGMYREFMRDTCEQFVAQPSSGCHTVVGVLPFSAAAVVLRLLWRGPQGSSSWLQWALGWLGLAALHAVLLVQLHRVASGYLSHFQQRATRARQRG